MYNYHLTNPSILFMDTIQTDKCSFNATIFDDMQNSNISHCDLTGLIYKPFKIAIEGFNILKRFRYRAMNL